MPEAATEGVLWKNVFFKTTVQEETPVNFEKFLKTPFFTEQIFTEQLRTTACEMRTLKKRSERLSLSRRGG